LKHNQNKDIVNRKKTQKKAQKKATQKKDKQRMFGGPSLLFTIYKQQLF